MSDLPVNVCSPMFPKRVHAAMSMTQQKTLCGRQLMWQLVEGQRFGRVVKTARQVNCKQCRIALEMVLRGELMKLSYEQLVQVLALISGMRSNGKEHAGGE